MNGKSKAGLAALIAAVLGLGGGLGYTVQQGQEKEKAAQAAISEAEARIVQLTAQAEADTASIAQLRSQADADKGVIA
ncbi:MAG: hypothetical protein IJ048_03315, partial [Clostridia bacterium]|nr:hypothetical protein [Clostridia bacterium]